MRDGVGKLCVRRWPLWWCLTMVTRREEEPRPGPRETVGTYLGQGVCLGVSV